MPTFLKIILVVAGVIIVPAIAFIIYLSFADLTVHKEYVEKELSEGIGHDVSINGRFDLQVGGKILFTAEEVTAANPEWPESGQYLSAGRIHILIDAWSAFGEGLQIDLVELSDVDLNLHQDSDGRGNWEPNLTEIQTTAVEFDDTEEMSVALHQLVLSDIGVSFQKAGNAAQRVTIDSLQMDRETGGAMSVELGGGYTDGTMLVPFAMTGEVQLESDSLTLQDTTIDIGEDSLIVNGSIGFDGTSTVDIQAEGASLASSGDAFGAGGLPALPYSLSAHLSMDPDTIALQDMTFVIGDGEISGSMAVELSQDKPHLVAKLNSPLLDLRTQGAAANEVDVDDAETIATEDTKIFGEEPLAYSWLDSVNVNADVSVASLVLADDQLENLSLTVVLDDGALTIDPLRFDSGEGELTASLDLRPNAGQHVLGLNVTTNNLRLGALALEGQTRETIPPLDLKIELGGVGVSMHEIMSSANGSIAGRQGTGQINLQAAGILFSDLVTSILRTLNPLAETETVTNLECGVYEVSVVEGIASIEQLALQTEKLTIVSSGNVNFSTEDIDMTLRTKTREGLGVSLGGVANSFLKIGGTLGAPSLGVDAAGSVTTTGAAVATGGLSVLARGLWDRASAEADICAQSQDVAAEPE